MKGVKLKKKPTAKAKPAPAPDARFKCSYTKLMPIAELKKRFHPKNPNVHTPEQIERLSKVLVYQGARKPATLSLRSDLLTAGHGRILAAERAGWDAYPVDYQEYDSDEQEYADLVADNALSEWSQLDLGGINAHVPELGPDFDLDMLGIKDFVLEPAEMIPQADEDAVPENVDTRCKLGDVWTLGRHRLMCGDSTSIDAVDTLMGGEKADMVFTDPPYGIAHSGKGITANGVEGNDFGKILGDDDVSVAVDSFNLAAGLFPEATLIFWGANYYCSSLPNGFGWLVWDKEREGNTFSGAELAFVNKGVRLDVFRHMWHGMVKASEHGQKRIHPTQKPIALAEWCFDNYGDPKSVVDLFGGSGSTLIACEKTSRKCFMMELDPHYCDVILARWEAYTGKLAERANG